MAYGRIPQNFDNRFLRAYSCRIDPLGIDPLQDVIAQKVLTINEYTTHTVTQDERAAPDLISWREYKTTDFWWHIIAYNELISYREIVEGLVLRIPKMANIIALTTDSALRQNNAEPTVVYI